MGERARDYVAQYVADLPPEKRAALDKKNAEFFVSDCADCTCDCEVKP